MSRLSGDDAPRTLGIATEPTRRFIGDMVKFGVVIE